MHLNSFNEHLEIYTSQHRNPCKNVQIYIYQYLYFFVQGEFMYKLCIKFLGENSDLKKKFLNIVENKESIPTYIECKVQY